MACSEPSRGQLLAGGGGQVGDRGAEGPPATGAGGRDEMSLTPDADDMGF